MGAYTLRLCEDRLTETARLALTACPRVVYVLAGELEVRIAARHGRVMKPGDAWFESGIEPVHAIASTTTPTSFIRVSILPRAIRGQSSLVYVDPTHAAVKPRQY